MLNCVLAAQLGGIDRRASFICETEHRTSPVVTWYHIDTMLIISNDKYVLHNEQSTLTILNVVGADEGWYWCSFMVNQEMMNSTAGYLRVLGK